ncbi:CDK2-associated and cullin domain-containing protein 1 [Octopus sinensis]|uniref:CDK2-associated and cullin domain-containing protein 1 n=1 Tax=Octopus sinensis TaxID=2607531 RepID=A0A6P7T4A5_9MOLL|nr:CDK2-associated and cullin domain-containing protein 1 [Octopus sinensis]
MDEEPMEAMSEEVLLQRNAVSGCEGSTHSRCENVDATNTRMVHKDRAFSGSELSSVPSKDQNMVAYSQTAADFPLLSSSAEELFTENETTSPTSNSSTTCTTTHTNTTNTSDDTRKSPGNPLVRPGTMVMMTITDEEYETQYLPQLMDAINQLLTIAPGTYIPISYEQMYSCVYKCVCKQFSERLYTDLINHIRRHLGQVDSHLKECRSDSTMFVERFSVLMNQYLQALNGIVPIFNYMNRFYVETKLKTDLNKELRNLFSEIVVEQHVNNLLNLLEKALSVPFTISPPVMASIIKNLYSLNPEYAQLKPDVFAKYIPNIRPPTSISELDEYGAEDRKMQLELLHNPEFSCSDSSRKRRSEEEIPRCGQPSH